MSAETGVSVRVRKLIQAEIVTVFRAWTDPEQLRQWSCPEGSTIDDVGVDLRVGGRFRIRMQSEAGVHTAFGTYREIVPPRRLVYTWDWEEPQHAVGETVVTVEFFDRGNATEVVLTHERLPTADARRSHSDGWLSCLTKLERLVPGGT